MGSTSCPASSANDQEEHLKTKRGFNFQKKSRVNLAANCEVCQSKMYKCVSTRNLSDTLNCFHMEKLHNLHILDCKSSTSNDYSADTDNVPNTITENALTHNAYIKSLTSHSSAVETNQRRMAL